MLGLITTKRAELEDKQTVIDRIHEAAEIVVAASEPVAADAALRKLRNRQQTHRRTSSGRRSRSSKKSPKRCGDAKTFYRRRNERAVEGIGGP